MDFPALFGKVVCDVWRDKEQTRLLFVRPQCLDLSEHFGSHAELGFHRKLVLPPLCLYFDHCVESLVPVVVDSLRLLFQADDLRGEPVVRWSPWRAVSISSTCWGLRFIAVSLIVHVLLLYMKHERLG